MRRIKQVNPKQASVADGAATAADLIASGRHVFIEASAGSGKTTRLVELVVNIIETRRATIAQILCVTFTEKAASELKAKIYAQLAASVTIECATALRDFALNRIGTIHSFCLRSLQEDAAESLSATGSAMARDSEIFEEARDWVYREVWSEFESGALNMNLQGLDFGKGGSQRAFDAELKAKALYAFAAETAAITPNIQEHSAIQSPTDFKAYTLFCVVKKMREIATTRRLMTYSTMITRVADRVGDPDFVVAQRQEYRYALIDEFQDTDVTQWAIFRTLFLTNDDRPGNTRLIVVGDPKQAIYKFRGADVFVYLKARTEMAACGTVFDTLPYNYRSADEILTPLDAIFESPITSAIWEHAHIRYEIPQRGKQQTESTADAGIEIYHNSKYVKDGLRDYYAIAATRIAEIQKDHPKWSIAVVAYRHDALEAMAEILRARRIDYAYYKQRPNFARLDFEHLQAFLMTFTLPEAQGYAVARETLLMVSRNDAEYFYAKLSGLIAAGKIYVFLQMLAQNFAPVHLMLRGDPDPTIYHAWRVLFQILLGMCGSKIFDIETLLRALRELADEKDDTNLHGDMLRNENAVTLLTVQSAKGLDWNAVVIADGLHDNRWQSYPFFHAANGEPVIPCDEKEFNNSTDKLLTTEDESRVTQLNLLYVALTRAKQNIIAYVSPAFASTQPGPVAFFLSPWLKSAAPPPGLRVIDMSIATIPEPTVGVNGAAPSLSVDVVINHGDIPQRISERTSFSGLSQAEFSDSNFLEDILPRGAQTGQLLHDILEDCDFSIFTLSDSLERENLRNEILSRTEHMQLHEDLTHRKVAGRVFDIVANCAQASLPLAQGGETTLAKISRENLWREMPFWSSSEIHRILRGTNINSRINKTMHGFMDLVFTPNERDYYILDYKSNSLADVEPANIETYTREHYGLQAEIYTEALAKYLATYYPDGSRRVAGCYFLFLRYLEPSKTIGVFFMESQDA
jgi:exodeoxyribonuclease V beta subunit